MCAYLRIISLTYKDIMHNGTHPQVNYPLPHELPLYYTLKDRKSLKTLRIEYGQLGLKFVLRMFEGQIDRRGEREELPKEILFEDEHELLKRIHEIKNKLKETEWSESPPPKVTQPSFLRTDLGRGEMPTQLII